MRKHFCDLCKAEMKSDGLSGYSRLTLDSSDHIIISGEIKSAKGSPQDVCDRCVARALRQAAEKLDRP
jgi:hypothetical protein